MTVEPFVFETTYEASTARRTMVERERATGRMGQDMVLLVSGVLGFLLLLSRYTFALGAGVLAVSTFGFAMKNRARSAPDRVAEAEPKPITVRVTEAGYSISSPSSSATGTWENVRGFGEMGGYFTLHT